LSVWLFGNSVRAPPTATSIWILTFSGSGVDSATGSIAEGVYNVTVNHADVANIGDGSVAMTADQSFKFDCLPGDVNGDNTVDGTDQTAFLGTYLLTSTDPLFQAAFDFNGDGVIDSSDASAFASDFGSTISWSAGTRVVWTGTRYDADGEVIKKLTGANTGSPIAQEVYTYDSAGRLSTDTDFEGTITSYAYDSIGEISAETVAVPGSSPTTTTYTYDDTGNRNSVADAAGTSTYSGNGTSGTFAGQDNRLASDGTWNYYYDDAGNRTTKVSLNGSGEEWLYFYDASNELVEAEHLNDGVNVDLREEYQYDAWGNRVATSTDTDGDGYQSNSQWAGTVVYDSSQDGTSTADGALGTPDATYGSSGNGWTPGVTAGVSNLTLGYTTHTYDNGVTVVESGANGFVTEIDLIDTSNVSHVVWTGTDTTAPGSDGNLTISFPVTTYQVKAVNIVIDQKPGTSPQIDAVSLQESGSSTTTASNASPVVTNYVLDGWNPMKSGGVGTSDFAVRMDVNAADGSLATRYLWSDQVDEAVGRVDYSYSGGTTTASAKWYVLDRQDSISRVVDDSGNVLDALTYDAYGNILTETDPTQRGRYAWTGRELDAETGLQYNRARWYDPTVGQWITQDPMGFDAGDSNLYRYAKNGPTDVTDPSGFQEPNPRSWSGGGTYAPAGSWGPSMSLDEAYLKGKGIDYISVGALNKIVQNQLKSGKALLLQESEVASDREVDKKKEWTLGAGWGVACVASKFTRTLKLIPNDAKRSVIEINGHSDETGMFNDPNGALVDGNADRVGKELGGLLTRDGIIVLSGCNVGLQINDSFAQKLANSSGHTVYAGLGYSHGTFVANNHEGVSAGSGLYGAAGCGYAPFPETRNRLMGTSGFYRVFIPK
jgi:RHS repeat-associated protein